MDSKRRGVWPLAPRLAELVVLAIAAFCLAVLLTQDAQMVTGFLYSPYAIILLVVVLSVYLIIKGGDRSRLYRIELERMQEREQEHVARTRRALAEIEQARRAQGEGTQAEVRDSLGRIEQMLRPDLKE